MMCRCGAVTGLQHLLDVSKMNDPEQISRRPKLILPAPQISDDDMEEIVKMGALPSAMGGGGTPGLASTLGRTPLVQAARTPLARKPSLCLARDLPLSEDNLLLEAQNLVALTQAETPLKGGENTPLHPSDFSGITPKRQVVQVFT